MDTVAFIGDELSGSGFRLAGARVYTVALDAAASALAEARASASLVLVGAAHARALPSEVLAEALASPAPLTLVVDDILERQAAPDLESELRRALGLEFS